MAYEQLAGAYSTATPEMMAKASIESENRKLKASLRRFATTGRADRFLRDYAQRNNLIREATSVRGGAVQIVTTNIGTFDATTGRGIDANSVIPATEPQSKKSVPSDGTGTLASAEFDVCENGQPVTWVLYGYKKPAA